MNSFNGVGNLVRDVETRYSESGMVISKFTIAIDSGFGDKKKTDFIPVVCFGKTAESVDRYLSKGKKAGVTGRVSTGSYENKNGDKVYTTEILADRVEFLSPASGDYTTLKEEFKQDPDLPQGFAVLEDDDEIPF